ncbi:MAG: hypothetical protein AAF205_14035 [Pseudomonadota bacterium]
MVMRPADPQRGNFGNSFLLWLGVGIFLVGGSFIYFYGNLRASTLSPSDTVIDRADDDLQSRTVPREAQRALQELGIDPDESGLSPEAQTAIARAHQAALAANRETVEDDSAIAAETATGADGAEDVSGGDDDAGTLGADTLGTDPIDEGVFTEPETPTGG